MDLMRLCPTKVVSAEEAVSQIKSGSRVFVGTGCGEPQHLIEAMVNDTTIQDVLVYQMLSSTFSRYIADKSFQRRFFLKN
jgi:acyl-CoA hydrolase